MNEFYRYARCLTFANPLLFDIFFARAKGNLVYQIKWDCRKSRRSNFDSDSVFEYLCTKPLNEATRTLVLCQYLMSLVKIPTQFGVMRSNELKPIFISQNNDRIKNALVLAVAAFVNLCDISRVENSIERNC